MKSKASLVLMEQLVMILVFALSAALCLSLFVQADRISRETTLQDRAVVLAQTGAETIKACRGDFQKAAGLLSGSVSDHTLTLPEEGIVLQIAPLETEIPGLGSASVTVRSSETGEELFCLTVSWQEVAE